VGGIPLSIYTYRTKYSMHYATNGKGEVTDVAGATRRPPEDDGAVQ